MHLEPVHDGQFRLEIQEAINRASAENRSNTPDFILAQYLLDCLEAFDRASILRERWYNCYHEPGDGL